MIVKRTVILQLILSIRQIGKKLKLLYLLGLKNMKIKQMNQCLLKLILIQQLSRMLRIIILIKKIFQEKEKRTIEATSYALKNAEKLAKSKKTEKNAKIDILNSRKIFWFEKFYWFISSENYLVLSGRDQQQNELLVKKYMNKDDLYMHADFHGAASTIIKNPTPQYPIGITTLQEAAQFAGARSKAWDSKILADAWWVYANQVSKSAPTGEYLPSGSFMIRGKKNVVHPMRMEMGFTLLFKIDEKCVEKHKGERKPKYMEEQESKKEEIKNEGQTNEEIEQNELRKKINEEENNQITMVNLTHLAPRIRTYDKSKQQNVTKQQQDKKKDKQTLQEQEKQQQQQEEISPKQEKKLTERQKKKLKKIQEKYGEQEEDEREMMMQLMGSKPVQLNQPEVVVEEKDSKLSKKGKKKQASRQNQKQQKKQEKAAKFDELFNKLVETKDKPIEQQEEENQQIEQISQSEETKNNKPEQPENPVENNNQTDPATEQDKEIEQKDSEDEELKQELLQQKEEEEKEKQAEEELKEAEKSNTKFEYQNNEIDMLVGTLFSDDQYYFCVPMCGPYSSLTNNKFKVKLTPGNLKKGKVAKTSLALFLGQKDCDPVSRKMMKNLSDLDLVNNIVGNAKVVAPGIQKIKDKEKQNKKLQKREQFEKLKQKQN
eukprot:TRINITY_DN2513_c0_g1_i2.p1 TRINITY_DN2513_c0_g1~~TRINITY_DN2513_c0_g1_i2.p1  ORF type:complete len:659 (-),score=167.92 TRINITY_DN2513_c0_g1_i2:74-2050(-)